MRMTHHVSFLPNGKTWGDNKLTSGAGREEGQRACARYKRSRQLVSTMQISAVRRRKRGVTGKQPIRRRVGLVARAVRWLSQLGILLLGHHSSKIKEDVANQHSPAPGSKRRNFRVINLREIISKGITNFGSITSDYIKSWFVPSKWRVSTNKMRVLMLRYTCAKP